MNQQVTPDAALQCAFAATSKARAVVVSVEITVRKLVLPICCQLQNSSRMSVWKGKQAHLLGRGRLGSSVEFPVTADTAELAAAWNDRTAETAAEAFAAAIDSFSENGCCADVLPEAFAPTAGASAATPGATAAAAGATAAAASKPVTSTTFIRKR